MLLLILLMSLCAFAYVIMPLRYAARFFFYERAPWYAAIIILIVYLYAVSCCLQPFAIITPWLIVCLCASLNSYLLRLRRSCDIFVPRVVCFYSFWFYLIIFRHLADYYARYFAYVFPAIELLSPMPAACLIRYSDARCCLRYDARLFCHFLWWLAFYDDAIIARLPFLPPAAAWYSRSDIFTSRWERLCCFTLWCWCRLFDAFDAMPVECFHIDACRLFAACYALPSAHAHVSTLHTARCLFCLLPAFLFARSMPWCWRRHCWLLLFTLAACRSLSPLSFIWYRLLMFCFAIHAMPLSALLRHACLLRHTQLFIFAPLLMPRRSRYYFFFVMLIILLWCLLYYIFFILCYVFTRDAHACWCSAARLCCHASYFEFTCYLKIAYFAPHSICHMPLPALLYLYAYWCWLLLPCRYMLDLCYYTMLLRFHLFICYALRYAYIRYDAIRCHALLQAPLSRWCCWLFSLTAMLAIMPPCWFFTRLWCRHVSLFMFCWCLPVICCLIFIDDSLFLILCHFFILFHIFCWYADSAVYYIVAAPRSLSIIVYNYVIVAFVIFTLITRTLCHIDITRDAATIRWCVAAWYLISARRAEWRGDIKSARFVICASPLLYERLSLLFDTLMPPFACWCLFYAYFFPLPAADMLCHYADYDVAMPAIIHAVYCCLMLLCFFFMLLCRCFTYYVAACCFAPRAPVIHYALLHIIFPYILIWCYCLPPYLLICFIHWACSV